MGGAHLRDLRGLPSWQLERTGLVEGPGLLHVLDELEQPRSTCRSTYTMSMPCVVTHSSAHSPPKSLQRAGTKPRPVLHARQLWLIAARGIRVAATV